MGVNNILVIKLRHIGDVLLTTPTFRALKTALPGARITAVVPAGMEELLTLNPSISEVIPFHKGRGILYELGFLKKIRDKRFDISINMTEGDRGAVLSFVSGARVRIGIDPRGKGLIGKRRLFTHLIKWGYDDFRHRAVKDMDVLAPLDIDPGEPVVEMFTSPDDDEAVARLLAEAGILPGGPFAVVHPTSRWLFKCWRDEAVASVMDYIEAKGVRVVITSGPDKKELEKARRIISLATRKPIDLSGRLSLKRFASLCKGAKLFFGVDSAPMHIAAAVGVPVVALFGPSDSRVWGPFSQKAAVLKAEGFPCMPCNRDGCNGTKKSKCIEAITEDEAIEAIERYL
ncbi:MAG: putative lipopolysaccharide heptosyltransferase III [Nitrospirota bacterium]